MNQKGLAPILIIAITLVIAVTILVFGIYISQKPSKKPVNGQNTPQIKDCSNSYGGCDKDKDFYKWTDDGLP